MDWRKQHITRTVLILSITVQQTIICFIGLPFVSEEKNKNEKNRGQWITVTIKSVPAPCHVQWRAKRKEEDTFTPIDINAEEYKGTTVTLPNPVLCLRQKDQEENCFQIEVTNFIGKTWQNVSGKITRALLLKKPITMYM